MTGPEHVTEFLFEYLEGSLSDEARLRIESHLKSCPACQREIKFAQGLRKALSALPMLPLPAGFKERVYEQLPMKNYAVLLRPTPPTAWQWILQKMREVLAAINRHPRLAFGGIGSLIVLLAAFFSLYFLPRSYAIATLYVVDSKNVMHRYEDKSTRNGEVILRSGSVISTAAGNRGVLVLNRQSTVRMEAGSRLIVTDLRRFPRTNMLTASFQLDSGRFWFAKNQRLNCTVATKQAQLFPIGTVFEVRNQSNRMQVNVWDGQVNVISADDPKKMIPLGKGEQMTVAKNGDFFLPGAFTLKPADSFQKWNAEIPIQVNPPRQPLLLEPRSNNRVYQVGEEVAPTRTAPTPSPSVSPTDKTPLLPRLDAETLKNFEVWERRHPKEASQWKKDHPDLWEAIQKMRGAKGEKSSKTQTAVGVVPPGGGRTQEKLEPRRPVETKASEDYLEEMQAAAYLLKELKQVSPWRAKRWMRNHPKMLEEIQNWRTERKLKLAVSEGSERQKRIAALSSLLMNLEKAKSPSETWKKSYPNLWQEIQERRTQKKPAESPPPEEIKTTADYQEEMQALGDLLKKLKRTAPLRADHWIMNHPKIWEEFEQWQNRTNQETATAEESNKPEDREKRMQALDDALSNLEKVAPPPMDAWKKSHPNLWQDIQDWRKKNDGPQ